MPHRYGRHGPRAWLRRRASRSHTSVLPAPAPLVQQKVKAIYVRVPLGISTERIIFIIMQRNGEFEEDQGIVEAQILQHLSLPSTALSDTEGKGYAVKSGGHSLWDQDIIRLAEEKADGDVYFLTAPGRDKHGIYIQRQSLVERARNAAFEDVGNFQRGVLDLKERARLRDVYRESYLSCFYRLIAPYPAILGYVEDDNEEELRRLAIADGAKPQSLGADRKVFHHKRDLGVLRVLRIYNYDVQDALDNLDKLHQLIDKYEEYQRNSGKEVIWPPPATFQGN